MTKFILGFVIACLLWLVILYNVEVPDYKIYDCGMAEWHPDIPKEVKEQCRQLRRQRPGVTI